MTSFENLLAHGQATSEEALSLFDSLAPINQTFMHGKWHGAGFNTNHPMDGLLETFGWHGKEFIDDNSVHPLVCCDTRGRLFNVDPQRIPMSLATGASLPRSAFMSRLFLGLKPLLQTGKPRARLRMMEYRGKVSATMVYDHLPIHDVFRKVDDNTVLGIMDLRGLEKPFFFILRRG
jgi:hypothetical protein